jgi:membrane-bound lytic murein transglycosylase B
VGSPGLHAAIRTLIGYLGLAGALALSPALPEPVLAMDTHRPDIEAFIAELAREDSFKPRELRNWLRKAQSQPAIVVAMQRPAEKAKPWYEYRSIFVNDRRIADGVEFWAAHRRELEEASQDSGVPPEYLVAILGVETIYGRQTGRFRVLDALATLAFDYPPRARFFRSELEQFFLLAREAAIDPLAAKGSYAGAMGAPQFMPSNYRRFAVNADHGRRIDLWSDWPDVFASIGNYFKEHGWVAGEPVLSDAAVASAGSALETDANGGDPKLDGRRLDLSDTVGTLRAQGLRFDTVLPITAPAVLIAVDEPDGVHWRVGFENFYAITRYNHSALYAMAVHDLAAAVKARLPP